MLLQTTAVILAIFVIALAWSKIGKKSTRTDFRSAILLTIIAFAVLVMAQGITDPPNGWIITIDLATIATWITLILACVTLAKGGIWAITKTDLYQKVMTTLDNVEKSCKSLQNIEKMYMEAHQHDS